MKQQEKKMKNETKNQIKQEMTKYKPEEFDLYSAEAGWQDWMNFYCYAQDDQVASESEIRAIESIQRELWLEVHPEVEQ